MPLVSVALEVGLVAGLWVLLFEINGWMFGAWATSAFANWIFLPAALRLVAVLICGWRGVLGLLIGALITNWLMQAPWVQAVALSVLSATGPWVAVRLATDHLKLPTDLHGLRFSHLLLFAALFVGLPLFGGPIGQLVADFYRAGSLVFGGGHVVLPLLQESVGHGISQQQFLTGYSLAQLVPGPMFTLATYLGAQLLPATPLMGALLATMALFLPGFLLLWAVGPCWQQWLTQPRLAGAVTGINAAVVGLLLAAFYQPVWQSAVLAPSDLALAAIGFYLLRVVKLPVLALAGLLVGAAILLA